MRCGGVMPPPRADICIWLYDHTFVNIIGYVPKYSHAYSKTNMVVLPQVYTNNGKLLPENYDQFACLCVKLNCLLIRGWFELKWPPTGSGADSSRYWVLWNVRPHDLYSFAWCMSLKLLVEGWAQWLGLWQLCRQQASCAASCATVACWLSFDYIYI